MIFKDFKNKLMRNGLEYFGLYYSDYEAIVVDNDDPNNRGRLKVKCPALFGDNTLNKWAYPKGMFAGKGVGFYAIPQKGDPVWLSFRKGKTDYPLWSYGWYPENYAPEKANKDVYILQTPKGYQVVIDEKNNELLVKKTDKDYIRIKEKISIYAGGENLFDVLNETMTALLKVQNIITPAGPGEFNPDTKKSLVEIKQKIAKLLE